MEGTDNSLLDAKVKIRLDHLPEVKIILLDCFGGHGVVWNEIKNKTGREIKRIAIDKELRKGTLKGDNRKWLAGFDLSVFNLIDIDAYGVPYDQLKIIFRSNFQGGVYFTFIQSVMGQMPHKMLQDVGISKEMIKQCPTLWGQIGFEIWLDWLALNGITKVYCRTHGRKHYGYFFKK